MLEQLRGKIYYQLVGFASLFIVPFAYMLLDWVRGPRGFASLFVGLLLAPIIVGLPILYIAIIIKAYSDNNTMNTCHTNFFTIFADLGYIIGEVFIIYAYLG